MAGRDMTPLDPKKTCIREMDVGIEMLLHLPGPYPLRCEDLGHLLITSFFSPGTRGKPHSAGRAERLLGPGQTKLMIRSMQEKGIFWNP